FQAAVVAGLAGGREQAVDRTVPTWQEIARIEATQLALDVPAQCGGPGHVAAALQRAAGHLHLQGRQVDPLAVAAPVDPDRGLLLTALEPGLAGHDPVVDHPGEAELAASTQRGGLGAAAPFQAASGQPGTEPAGARL